jgi:serine/threonine-protein kinase/endoribonuclease IRE1
MLESPVVRVFDVVRPLITDSDDLLVLPQPFVRSKRDDEINQEDSTFVGCTPNGGWFALSEANFPYVTRQASDANCYKNAPLWKSLPVPEREKLLVGVHKVQVSVQGVHRQSLPAPPRYESDTRNAYNGNDSPAASQSSIARVPSAFLKEAGHTSLVFSIGLFILSIFFLVSPGTVRGYYKSISGKHGDMSLDYPGSLTTPPRTPVVRQMPSEASEAPPAPSTAITVEFPEVKEPKEEEPKLEENKAEELEPEEIIVEELKADVPKAPTVRFEDPIPEPAKESTPETGLEDAKDDAETASEAAPPTPRKKKYQRGRRGGKKKKTNVETESNAAPEDADKGVQGRKEKLHNITVVSSGKVEEDAPGSPFILNSLEVYEDEVIGMFALPTVLILLIFSQGRVVKERQFTRGIGKANWLQ